MKVDFLHYSRLHHHNKLLYFGSAYILTPQDRIQQYYLIVGYLPTIFGFKYVYVISVLISVFTTAVKSHQ